MNGYTRELVNKHGFHMSKARGQHFLTDTGITERIVHQAGIGRENGVVEIGAGAGALTLALAREAGLVVALEVDRRLEPLLAEALNGIANVRLLWQDALKADWRQIAQNHLDGLEPVVCANLPYMISTPLITKLLESGVYKRLVLMVQRELAHRITAVPGTPEYGAFSVFSSYYAEAKILFDVPPSCFCPMPEVYSSVVCFDTVDTKIHGVADERLLFRIIRAAFGQRRKTLSNALKQVFGSDKELIFCILSESGIAPTARGETLSLQQFVELTNHTINKWGNATCSAGI